MEVLFWDWMVRNSADPFWIREQYDAEFALRPIWTFERIGQSHTMVDTRVISIGGEYDDSYDPDFQIYNDVVVRDFRGGVTIFEYPRDTFRPTDFHTATLVMDRVGYFEFDYEIEDSIFIIGCVGYHEDWELGSTPVYRLDLQEFSMHRVETCGEGPGWISSHEARLVPPHQIQVSGGRILNALESFDANLDEFELDLHSLQWTRLPGTPR